MTLMKAVCLAVFGASLCAAQPDNPLVSFTVTLPDGQKQQLTAAESRLATATLKDGTEYGFRPTIVDSKPWSHIVVTIFKMPTSTQAVQEVGEVDLKTGGPAVDSKTTPDFKIAVTRVDPPPAMKRST